MRLPVRRDDGSIELIEAFRAGHSYQHLPTKAVICLTPDNSLQETIALVDLMTCECAMFQIPFGGVKGAVRIDSRSAPPLTAIISLTDLPRN